MRRVEGGQASWSEGPRDDDSILAEGDAVYRGEVFSVGVELLYLSADVQSPLGEAVLNGLPGVRVAGPKWFLSAVLPNRLG